MQFYQFRVSFVAAILSSLLITDPRAGVSETALLQPGGPVTAAQGTAEGGGGKGGGKRRHGEELRSREEGRGGEAVHVNAGLVTSTGRQV